MLCGVKLKILYPIKVNIFSYSCPSRILGSHCLNRYKGAEVLIFNLYSGRSRILGSHCLIRCKGRVSVDFFPYSGPSRTLGSHCLSRRKTPGGGGGGLSVVPFSINLLRIGSMKPSVLVSEFVGSLHLACSGRIRFFFKLFVHTKT